MPRLLLNTLLSCVLRVSQMFPAFTSRGIHTLTQGGISFSSPFYVWDSEVYEQD